jgi:hypothetical protein
MLLANKFTMLIVPNTWIFQEINGTTIRDKQVMAKRNGGYYAGNMDRGIKCAQKNGL